MNKIKQHRRVYSREFKQEALALITEQGYSVKRASEALGLRCSLLYKWKQRFAQEQSSNQLDTDGRAELARLRKENNRLRMEKEILKKASAFFASEIK